MSQKQRKPGMKLNAHKVLNYRFLNVIY